MTLGETAGSDWIDDVKEQAGSVAELGNVGKRPARWAQAVRAYLKVIEAEPEKMKRVVAG